MESLPLADRAARSDLRCHPGADLGRKRRIRTVAPHLTRTDRPAPDVYLGFVPAAEKYPRIRVRDLDQNVTAGIVLLVCPIGQNNFGCPVDVWTFLDPPIHQQLEVAVISL